MTQSTLTRNQGPASNPIKAWMFPDGSEAAPGTTIVLPSGEESTPLPSGDLATDRRANNAFDRITAWRIANAIEEAPRRGIPLHGLANLTPKNLSKADSELLDLVLHEPQFSFPQRPALLRPLVSEEAS